MRGDVVTAGGTQLFVRRWGPNSGSPVLLFHSLGSAASAALLDVGLGPLAAAGYAIAAPDMPGFGESPPLDGVAYEIPRLAELGLVLADVLGWETFVVGGHSWGGAVAVHLAAAHPARVRALVLVDSGHLDYTDDPEANLDASLEELIAEAEADRLRAPDRAGLAADLDLAVADPLVDSVLAAMTDDGAGGLVTRTLGSTRGAAMYHLMRSRQSEQWPAIAAAGIPTLLLLATKPQRIRDANAAAADRFRAVLRHADIRFVEGASHSLIADMRARFGETVGGWLATLA
jgi:pimeloyl-ACP methyl ester carboxylesterase